MTESHRKFRASDVTPELRRNFATLRRQLVDMDFWIFDIASRHRWSELDIMLVPVWNKTDAVWVHPGITGKNIALRSHGSSRQANVIVRYMPPELPLVPWKRRMTSGNPEQNWGQFLTRKSREEARKLGIPV